uniref:Uncharacterized protein n=1 Tax=Strombidium rassoulzadegani TaxID=1082188 RepID=A0A7S3FXQ0_9SPIT|mmetsp:Transcript_4440/g.7567  ORF Transcript_4440/g.7567 Transcript_4440/m.7567 type:complete len:187 (+) Transcript_4440:2258-2818(+)
MSTLDAKAQLEQHLKLKHMLKQIQAFEQLFLNLALLLLVPSNLSVQSNSKLQTEIAMVLEDLQELKELFPDLAISAEEARKVAKSSSKKVKVCEGGAGDSKQQVMTALVDFLTSMLTKPHSFLREIANQCFKQFSSEDLPRASLERLLLIVSTPNNKAGEFMEGQEEAQAEEGEEESESELMEDSE